jgi:arylsulfatase A-like enzyme
MAEKRAKLVALIEHMDSGIGRVLDALDRHNLAGNTLVFFTSDNGGLLPSGANNGHWRSGKTHMYEGGLRVPAVARWPGKIQPESRSDRNLLTMDLFPTLCEAGGVRPPEGLDSRSFLPTLLRETTDEDVTRQLYFVRREGGPQYGGKTIEALISGEWKLLQDSPFAPLELYNLRTDPQEF